MIEASAMNPIVHEFVMDVCAKIKPEAYAFTVNAIGEIWDVYRFHARGKDGTVAFRIKPDGKVVIGVFCVGSLDETAVVKALSEHGPS